MADRRGRKDGRIQPGATVTTAAKEFGREWAKMKFPDTWQSERVRGVVVKAVGKHQYVCDSPPARSAHLHAVPPPPRRPVCRRRALFPIH